MRYLTILQPAALAAELTDAVAQISAAAPGTDMLLADLAIGRTDRVRTHLLTADPVPLVAARYVAWTGDLPAVAGAWEHIRAAALRMLHDPHAYDRARTCAELERTATDLGDVRLAAELHRAARAQPLSMTDRGEHAAATILRIVHDVIGIEPDAARMRLRLRPRLPPHEHRLVVHAIAFAGGVVRLEMLRSPAAIACRVAQNAGAIPFTILLEPFVHAQVRTARIDGRDAQLDVRTVDGGAVLPVQLVLDEERALEIDLDTT